MTKRLKRLRLNMQYDGLKFDVLDRHIAEGTPKQGTNCPVALALAEVVMPADPPDPAHIDVEFDSVKIGDDWYDLSRRGRSHWAAKWVREFDEGKTVEPSQFELSYHEPVWE